MADKEYIEREDLYSRAKRATNPYGKPTIDYESGVKVLKMIEQAPAADVAEVRRGRWLHQRTLNGEVVTCSECKTLGSPQWKWCPVCGADMRGKKNG